MRTARRGTLGDKTVPPMNRRMLRALVATLALPLLFGCLAPGHPLTARQRAIADAARPILTLAPDAVWTDCYNQLLALGPDSLTYLMSQPAMTRPAPPDDLSVLMHTSLVRLLANPAHAPRLTAGALETTLGVLYFEPKAVGRPLGTVVIPEPATPCAWHDLYPAEFNHAAAAVIDLEADRRALVAWWQLHRGHPAALLATARLEPRPDDLWRVLDRRYADRWQYAPDPRPVRCSFPPRGEALLDLATYDYNLVRAACIWLAAADEPAIRRYLIELVGSRSEIVAYNARFALRRCPDERIRSLLEHYAEPRPAPPGVGATRPVRYLLGFGTTRACVRVAKGDGL